MILSIFFLLPTYKGKNMKEFEEKRLIECLGKSVLNTYSMILINRIESVLFGSDLKKFTNEEGYSIYIEDYCLFHYYEHNNSFEFNMDLPETIHWLSPSIVGMITYFIILIGDDDIEIATADDGRISCSEFAEFSSEKYSTYEFWIKFKNKLEKMPFHKVEE